MAIPVVHKEQLLESTYTVCTSKPYEYMSVIDKQSSLQGHQLTGTILISKHAPMIEGHTEDD